jgi:hypothetical protein
MSKQTAVNWLRDEAIKLVAQAMQGTLNEDTLEYQISQIVTKALQMEREQMEKAVSNAISKADMIDNRGYFNFDKWYNETYGVMGMENKTFMSEEDWVKEYTGEKGRDIG